MKKGVRSYNVSLLAHRVFSRYEAETHAKKSHQRSGVSAADMFFSCSMINMPLGRVFIYQFTPCFSPPQYLLF